MTDRSQELFPLLCQVGNVLESIRDTTFPQGALWLQLTDVLAALDAVSDTLAARQTDGTPARIAARTDEEETHEAP